MQRQRTIHAETQGVTLGDGHTLDSTGVGMETLLPDGSTQKCTLNDVLYVPKLLKAAKAGNIGKAGCDVTH